MAATRLTVSPRTIRPAPDPLALYVRAGRNDHHELLAFLTSGEPACFGIVFDPTQLRYQKELVQRVHERRLDVILDPRTQPLATPGGYTESLGKLPWGSPQPQSPDDFQGTGGRRLARALAEFSAQEGFTQVIAPSHVLRSGDDPWWDLDRELVEHLRRELDRLGLREVPIIYSLAIPYAMLRDGEIRRELASGLRSLPIGSIWLAVDGFGSGSSATAICAHLDAVGDFHEFGIPLVGDHIGGMAGLAVLAFGGVGGIVHGVTFGEQFACASWRRPRATKPFGLARRVYIPSLDLMLKPAEARELFELGSKARSMFGCRDTHCCPRGVVDMIDNPARHFLRQRVSQVAAIARVPEFLRAERFLEEHLRPATDRVLAATNLPLANEELLKRIHAHRRRLDMLRVALGDLVGRAPQRPGARVPGTRRSRDTRETAMRPSL